MSTGPKLTSPRGADQAELSLHVEALLRAAHDADDPEGVPEQEYAAIDVYVPDELQRHRKLWQSNRSDGGHNALAVLKALEDHGTRWPLAAVPSEAELERLKRKFPNFSGPVDEVRRAAALARLAPSANLMLPPILLSGPPGVGKSKFARELSSVMRVPMLAFAMTQTTASFSLGGLNAQYSNGGPGDLMRAFAQNGVPDMLVVVDEIDKAASDAIHDPLGPLHDLLEQETAAHFVDDGLRLPVNLSALRWVCTCNDPREIAAPILSRLVHHEIVAPSVFQMREIVDSVYAEILSRHGFQLHFDPVLPEEVRDMVASKTPRDLSRTLRAALGSAALQGRRAIHVSDLPASLGESNRPIGFL